MIDLSKLKPSDVGGHVRYLPAELHGKHLSSLDGEPGEITGWNEKYVFVLYRGRTASQATYPRDLEWVSLNEDPDAPRASER